MKFIIIVRLAMKRDTKGVVVFAFMANLSIAIAKFTVSLITHSSALLSEAIHSLADTGNQILLLIGIKRSSKREDYEHPFGYEKEQFFWSFLVAVLLFFLGGLYSLYEGINKLNHPHTIETPWIGIGVLLFSLLAEGSSFLKAKHEIDKTREGKSIFEYFKNCYNAELLVVFFEDSAAITGILIAIISTLLYILTKNTFFDSLGSILIGILLIIVSLGLGGKMKSLIIGKSAPPEMIEYVLQTINNTSGVVKTNNLKTMILGKDLILAAAEVIFEKGTDIDKIDERIKEIETKILKKYPQIKTIYIEPKEEESSNTL